MKARLAQTIIVAATAMLSLSGRPAVADDAKPPDQGAPATRDIWSGPYVGLYAGAVEGESAVKSAVDCSVYGFLCDPVHYPQYGALIGATASGSKSQAGFAAGGAAGYNWRFDRFVYGVEADVASLRLDLTDRGSGSSLNLGLVNGGSPVVFSDGASAQIDGLATLRARAGYLAAPDVLVFATGGLALADFSVANSYSDNWTSNGGGVGHSRARSNATGYALGAGAEWAVARGWRLKAEYLRVGFGSQTTFGAIYPAQIPSAGNPFASSANLTANLFRVGLNYGF
jgi:outer membrane immunogenic protein